MNRIFLDTNIVLDFLGERVEFYDSAAKIMTLADQKKISLLTSPTSIANTFYLLAKYEKPKIALEKIRKFKLLCSISIMNDDVIEKALNSDFKDFEDAMQYYSALASGCDLILTRNERDFKNALIPVMDSDGFLNLFK